MQLWHSPFFDGGVENCPSSVGLYRVFNPLALWALPLYSLQEHRGRGLKVTLRSAFVGFLFSLLELFLLLRNSPQCCGTRQGEERDIFVLLLFRLLRYFVPSLLYFALRHPAMLRGTAETEFCATLLLCDFAGKIKSI